MKDIETRKDIELLVDSFYDKVKRDDVIGYFFNDVAKVNWDEHLPKLYDFWETTLFHKALYKGNPIEVHKHLNQIAPLNKNHFEHWVELFCNTVDALFKGNNAEQIKIKAKSIAFVMQLKIESKNA
jgi:hemoglobin